MRLRTFAQLTACILLLTCINVLAAPLCLPKFMTNSELATKNESTYAEAVRFNNKRLHRQLRYRTGSAVTEDSHIKLGFESEYTLDSRAHELLELYAPLPEFGVSKRQWLAMSGEAKIDWIKEHKGLIFTEQRQPGKLKKIVTGRDWRFLPDRLILDSTGNLEIIVSPFDTLEEWYSSVDRLNKRVLTGSMQTTQGLPTDIFFGRNGSEVEGSLGFYQFFADFDAIQKLDKGYNRLDENPDAEVAKSFQHPFLGPLTRSKALLLKRTLNQNAENKGWAGLAFVSGTDSSFKYIGSTVYRPDIAGPKYIVSEIRDAHSDMDVLTQRVLRGMYFLEKGMGKMKAAANIRPFDSDVDFKRFSSKTQKALKEIFPTKTKPGVEYSNEEVFALEVFRNFAFPMRDWTTHLTFIGRLDLKPELTRTQQDYLNTVNLISEMYLDNRITKEQASQQIQAALAKFAGVSGLARAFLEWEGQMLRDEIAEPVSDNKNKKDSNVSGKQSKNELSTLKAG